MIDMTKNVLTYFKQNGGKIVFNSLAELQEYYEAEMVKGSEHLEYLKTKACLYWQATTIAGFNDYLDSLEPVSQFLCLNTDNELDTTSFLSDIPIDWKLICPFTFIRIKSMDQYSGDIVPHRIFSNDQKIIDYVNGYCLNGTPLAADYKMDHEYINSL